jgi:hypothetical protein
MISYPKKNPVSRPASKLAGVKQAHQSKFGAILSIDLGGRGSSRFSIVPDINHNLYRQERIVLYAKTPVVESFYQKPSYEKPQSIRQSVLSQWAGLISNLTLQAYPIWTETLRSYYPDTLDTPNLYSPSEDKIRAISISFPGTVEDGQITQSRNLDQTYGFQWSGLTKKEFQKTLLRILRKVLPQRVQQEYWSDKLQSGELPIFIYNDIVAEVRKDMETFCFDSFANVAQDRFFCLMDVKVGTGIGSAIYTPGINLPHFNQLRNLPPDEFYVYGTSKATKDTPDQIQTTSLGVAPAINALARNRETVEDYFSHNGFIKQAKRLGIVPPGMQNDNIPAQVIDWAFDPQAPQHEKAKLIVDTGIETLATALAFFVASRNVNLVIHLSGGIVSGIERAAYKHGYISENDISAFKVIQSKRYLNHRLKQEIAKRIDPDQSGHRILIKNSVMGDSSLLKENSGLIGAALLAQDALKPHPYPKLQLLI